MNDVARGLVALMGASCERLLTIAAEWDGRDAVTAAALRWAAAGNAKTALELARGHCGVRTSASSGGAAAIGGRA